MDPTGLIILGLVGLAFYLWFAGNSDVTGDVPTSAQLPSITALAQGIARAEGFYVAGSLPARHNNPGDLTLGGINRTFSTIEEGWSALYQQIAAMINGTSRVYDPSMTFLEIAEKWTGGDGAPGNVPGSTVNWARTVADAVGATPQTSLSDVTLV